jgi:hypothetical protein
MPGIVVIGTQWGDEGKGKATDQLGDRVDYTVRYSGGNNAGSDSRNTRTRSATQGSSWFMWKVLESRHAGKRDGEIGKAGVCDRLSRASGTAI